MFQSTLMSGFQVIPGDPGDGRLNNYFLEHSFELISNPQYLGRLFSPTFFYPEPNVLAFSENLFGTAPIYWLFRVLTEPDNAFALWLMAISGLNFGAMVFTLRRLQVHPVLASLGGFLMAFPLSRSIRFAHAQLLPQFCTPLALLCFWQFLQQPSKILWVALLGFIYWQLLCSVYLGWFLLLGLSITAILVHFLLPAARQRVLAFLRQHWQFSLSATIVWAVSVILLLMPYFKVKKMFGPRSYAEVRTMLPRLSSWLVLPDAGSFWSAPLRSFKAGLPMVHEHHIFLGMTIYVLTLWTFFVWRRRSAWLGTEQRQLVSLFLGSGIVLFLISLLLPGTLISLWWLIYHLVPGATAIRAVTRIFTLLNIYLLIATLVALNGYLASKKMRRSAQAFVLTGLLSFAMMEQFIFVGGYNKLETRKPEQELVQLLKNNCQLAYYEMPDTIQTVEPTGKPFFPNQSTLLYPLNQTGYAPPMYVWITGQVVAMWAGIRANVPVLNGYSGFVPPDAPAYGVTWNVSRVLAHLDDLRSVGDHRKQSFQRGNFCHIKDRIGNDRIGNDRIATTTRTAAAHWQSQTVLTSQHYTMQVFRRQPD